LDVSDEGQVKLASEEVGESGFILLRVMVHVGCSSYEISEVTKVLARRTAFDNLFSLFSAINLEGEGSLIVEVKLLSATSAIELLE
jgi:hypothetical protein